MTIHSYHARTWRQERRRPLRRILGWIVAIVPWCILAVLWWGS
jgi:hypothetical protein